ncbi:MAG: FG-GAP-like repeat-containing protein [Bacteroidota bacterium]
MIALKNGSAAAWASRFLDHGGPILYLAILLVLAGCSSAVPASTPTSETAAPTASDGAVPTFVRQSAPFEIRDADGTPYTYPTLGGLNVPRPQLVDVDGDGDLDLFVQEYTGEIMFFENTGTPATPTFTFRDERFQDLDVGEWYRFADLDGDGDPDLLGERRYSYVKAYLNESSGSEPRFRSITDTLLTTDGTPLFADRQNILNIADLDCDGRLDLFLGRIDGTVSRYESIGTDEEGLPRFRLVTDRFEGIEIIGQFGQPEGGNPVPGRSLPNVPGANIPGGGMTPDGSLPGGSMHGANTLAFADVDGDGDPDLLWGDFFEPSLLLIENRGTCARPNLRSVPLPFPLDNPISTTGYNAPAKGDLDSDGDLDLLVGVLGGAFNANRSTIDNLLYYERTDDGYRLRTERFLSMLDVGAESTPALGDLDGDGDLDLLIANKLDPDSTETSRVVRFENVGRPGAPAFQLADTLALPVGYHYAPALGDLDGDGDLDLVLGTWKNRLLLYRNDPTAGEGAERFVLATDAIAQIDRGSNTVPALADLDDDGDLDLVVGESSGELNLFRNEGTPESPRFVAVDEAFGDFDAGRRSAPTFTDLDGDGDLDLVVGSEADGFQVLRNDGVGAAPQFTPAGTLDVLTPDLATPAFADLDGDGDLDLLTGGSSGGLVFFERR